MQSSNIDYQFFKDLYITILTFRSPYRQIHLAVTNDTFTRHFKFGRTLAKSNSPDFQLAS